MMGFISGMTSIAKSNAGNRAGERVSQKPLIKKESLEKEIEFEILTSEELKKLSSADKEIYKHALELHLLKEKVKLAKQQEKDLFKPVMFFDGRVFLKNGLVIKKGYQFKEGFYNENTVKKIDIIRRGYVLSNGEFVSM